MRTAAEETRGGPSRGDRSNTSRRLVQVGMIVFGVLIATPSVVSAWESAAILQSTAEPSTRRLLQLDIAARALRSVGVLGLFVSQALAFRDWRTYLLPFRPPSGLPRGRHAGRRIARQIDGRESYEPDEVALLRRVAEWRLGLQKSTVGNISLIMFACGVVLSPVGFSPEDPEALVTPFERAFQVLGLVLVVVLVAVLVAQRKATDRQAREFLEATRPAAKPNP